MYEMQPHASLVSYGFSLQNPFLLEESSDYLTHC